MSSAPRGSRSIASLGVSMGAFIGALFAMGLDLDEIDALCFEEWVQRRPLSDYTIPRHSLIRGERFRAMLHRTFGETLIEELPRSFMCGFTELRSGRLVIARHGSAVGGGRLQRVPADPRATAGPRPRDVHRRRPGRQPSRAGDGRSRRGSDHCRGRQGDARAARRRAARRDRRLAWAARTASGPTRVPTLGETLARVLSLGSANTSEAARRHADLVIKPRAEGVGLLEFHQLDVAVEAGRVAARAALEDAPGSLFA